MPRAHSPAELQQINDAIVTVDDLMELNDSMNRLETTDANDTEFAWMGAAALQARDEDHGVALIARWIALTGFVKDNRDSAWIARESEDGPPLASTALFAAAAVEPVIDRNGMFEFDRQSFLDRVLELANGPGPV